MSDIPLDKLWQWWQELAARELTLERQYKPLLNETERVHRKRTILEQLIVEQHEKHEDAQKELAEEWQKLLERKNLPTL